MLEGNRRARRAGDHPRLSRRARDRPQPQLMPQPLRHDLRAAAAAGAAPAASRSSERLAADGRVLTPLDEGSARPHCASRARGERRIGRDLLPARATQRRARARAKEVLQALLPGVDQSARRKSCRSFASTSAFPPTVICLLAPVMDRYMSSLSGKLGDAGIAATCSRWRRRRDHGSRHPRAACRCARFCRGRQAVSPARCGSGARGPRDFITCDMGGTSTDVCLIENLQAAWSARPPCRATRSRGRRSPSIPSAPAAAALRRRSAAARCKSARAARARNPGRRATAAAAPSPRSPTPTSCSDGLARGCSAA